MAQDDSMNGAELLKMLEAVIEADLVKTIMDMPHLSLAERRIALGRALRKGLVQQLAKQLIQEETAAATLEKRKVSDALAEALLTTSPVFARA